MTLRAWARGPFELIVHGELHFRSGEDFDRRVTLISFDNAIEVSITNYLSLHPIHRKNREYSRDRVNRALQSFHTKLDFLMEECSSRTAVQNHDIGDLVWYHQQRNNQYHEGTYAAPNLDVLVGLRDAALWVFSFLYDIDDVLAELELEIESMSRVRATHAVERTAEYDELIDSFYDAVSIADGIYSASELLYLVDPDAYREKALELMETEPSGLRIVS